MGELERIREAERGESRAETWSLCGLREQGDESGHSVRTLQPPGAEVEQTLLPEWSTYTVAEPSDQGRSGLRGVAAVV